MKSSYRSPIPGGTDLRLHAPSLHACQSPDGRTEDQERKKSWLPLRSHFTVMILAMPHMVFPSSCFALSISTPDDSDSHSKNKPLLSANPVWISAKEVGYQGQIQEQAFLKWGIAQDHFWFLDTLGLRHVALSLCK